MKEQLFTSEIQYKDHDGNFISFTLSVDEDDINVSCGTFSELVKSDSEFIKSTISDLIIRIMDTKMMLKAIKYDSDGYEYEGPISLGKDDFFDMMDGIILKYPYDN